MKTMTLCASFLCVSLLASFAQVAETRADDPQEGSAPGAHYQRANEPHGRTAYVQLPPGVVRPEGWLRDWCVAARKGVLGHPYDYPNPEQAIVFGKGWTGEDTPGAKGAGPHGRGWPAEQCATWLEGAIKLGVILDDQALVDEIKGRLLLVAENVLKAPDDAFMFMWWTTKDDYPWAQTTTPNKLDWFDVQFGNGNLGTAMATAYEITKDPRLLQAIEKALRPNNPHFKDKPGWFSVGGGDTTREGCLKAYAHGADSMKDNLAFSTMSGHAQNWLKENDGKTGNLLDFSKRTHTASYLYGRISAIAGFPWGENNKPILEMEERMLRAVEQYYMLPSGAMQGDEDARGLGAYKGNESCTTMQIRWAGALLAASGRGYYGDRTEECLFNFLPACWTRDMQAYTYFSRLNNHDQPNMQGQWYKPLHGTLCCPGQMLKAMTYFVQNMWMATWDNGLAWTFYGPCSLKVKAGPGNGVIVSLKGQTDYPFGESIALAVDPERPVTFPLRLRVPRWCDGFAVEVNGAAADAKADGSGFVELRREWKAGDRVEIQMPMTPRVHVARELEGAPFAAVRYGPLCMTLPVEEAGKTEIDPAAEWKFAIDAPEGAEKSWKVERAPMPAKWDWPLAAPLALKVTATRADWAPIQRKAHDVAEELKRRDNVVTHTQNDVTCLPPQPFPDGSEKVELRLVPYGCAKFHVTMFPITARTAPRIVAPNPDPSVTAPLFVKESEIRAPEANVPPQANP
jgi:hypothetical protein